MSRSRMRFGALTIGIPVVLLFLLLGRIVFRGQLFSSGESGPRSGSSHNDPTIVEEAGGTDVTASGPDTGRVDRSRHVDSHDLVLSMDIDKRYLDIGCAIITLQLTNAGKEMVDLKLPFDINGGVSVMMGVDEKTLSNLGFPRVFGQPHGFSLTLGPDEAIRKTFLASLAFPSFDEFEMPKPGPYVLQAKYYGGGIGVLSKLVTITVPESVSLSDDERRVFYNQDWHAYLQSDGVQPMLEDGVTTDTEFLEKVRKVVDQNESRVHVALAAYLLGRSETHGKVVIEEGKGTGLPAGNLGSGPVRRHVPDHRKAIELYEKSLDNADFSLKPQTQLYLAMSYSSVGDDESAVRILNGIDITNTDSSIVESVAIWKRLLGEKD